MRPTRMIRPTMYPIATKDQMATGGYLQRKFAMMERNYLKCWEDAHAEQAERDAQSPKVALIKRAKS